LDRRLREELIEDLIYLRKDAGFVPERLKIATAFVEVVGQGDADFDTLKNRLLSALDSLSEPDADCLLAAFGLLPDYAGMKLTARREQYGALVKRKTDTLVDRENTAIKELALVLLCNRYTNAPLPASAPAYHNAALEERVEILTIVRDRLWLETRNHFRLIPLIDGAEFLEISSSIPAVITPTCDCVTRTKTTPNGLTHRFIYAEPLKRGKPVDLSFVMNPDVSQDKTLNYALLEESRAFHEPTMSFRVEVVFLGEKPEVLWQYKQLPFFTRPGEPTGANLLDSNNSSTVAAEFSDLYGGLFSGIAWRWGR
jgi:hypothetical protein